MSFIIATSVLLEHVREVRPMIGDRCAVLRSRCLLEQSDALLKFDDMDAMARTISAVNGQEVRRQSVLTPSWSARRAMVSACLALHARRVAGCHAGLRSSWRGGGAEVVDAVLHGQDALLPVVLVAGGVELVDLVLHLGEALELVIGEAALRDSGDAARRRHGLLRDAVLEVVDLGVEVLEGLHQGLALPRPLALDLLKVVLNLGVAESLLHKDRAQSPQVALQLVHPREVKALVLVVLRRLVDVLAEFLEALVRDGACSVELVADLVDGVRQLLVPLAALVIKMLHGVHLLTHVAVGVVLDDDHVVEPLDGLAEHPDLLAVGLELLIDARRGEAQVAFDATVCGFREPLGLLRGPAQG